MTRWGFVRHGESHANAEGWLAGHIDADLTQQGRAQARALNLDASRWQRVVSSDLTRAWRTAALGMPGVQAPRVSALRERTIGAWDGRRVEELRASGDFSLLLTWDGAPPQGESNAMLARRVLGWLANQPEHDTLVFAHAGVIRSIVGLLDGVDRREIPLMKIANTQCLEREVASGTWSTLLGTLQT